MKNEVETMTDAALLAACRKRPWERRMAGVGCGLSLAVGVLAVYGVFRLLGGAGWLLAVFVFFAVGVTVLVKVSGLADYRARRQQAELRRRHEPQDFEAEVREAEADLNGASAPDWILLLRGRGLPHGGTIAIRIELRIELRQAEPPGGHISVHTVGEIDFDRDEPLPVARGGGEIDAQGCESLQALLPDFVAHNSETIPDFVFDGFPCRLAAVRRQPRLTARGDCNLAGISEKYTEHPTPLMMERMLELSRQVTTAPVVFGWCDSSGNIGVGEA